MEQPVAISPDLHRIAYAKGPADQNTRELHLAAIDGSGDWIYSQASPLLFQSWSPDSSHFIYSVGVEQEAWIGSLQEPPKVLDPSFLGAQSTTWTSDDQFLFWLPRENTFELNLGTLEGGIKRLDTVFSAPPEISFVH